MPELQPIFIVNPQSGGGRTRKRWPLLADALRRAGIDPQAVFTEAPGHGTELAREAIAYGRDTLIAVGGDGTVNEVATAILAGGHGDDVRMGTIGMGTGKDIAKCLAMGRAVLAIRAIAAGAERRIDAGRVDAFDASGLPSRRYFLLEASAGWVPEISQATPRWLKRLGDTAPYVLTGFAKMFGPMGREFDLTIDDEGFVGRYNSVSVHNMELWGGDLVVAPGALPDDGLFDVIRWGDLGRAAVLKSIQAQRAGGTHLDMDGIDHHHARRVEISASRGGILDIDGEHGGYLPAMIEMLPLAIRFVAPAV